MRHMICLFVVFALLCAPSSARFTDSSEGTNRIVSTLLGAAFGALPGTVIGAFAGPHACCNTLASCPLGRSALVAGSGPCTGYVDCTNRLQEYKSGCTAERAWIGYGAAIGAASAATLVVLFFVAKHLHSRRAGYTPLEPLQINS